MGQSTFDLHCQRCQRLAGFLQQLKQDYPSYHAAPVPAFGEVGGRLLVVGLAPGMHGANASGRPFTGDYAGELLYRTLYDYGFSSAPVSRASDDGLRLRDCRITNAVKCLPPQNRPLGSEVNNCNDFLAAELDQLAAGAVVLALGTVAHRAVLKAFGLKLNVFPFAHGAVHALASDQILIDSYHCSRYNLQTKRLTETMFRAVFDTLSRWLQR